MACSTQSPHATTALRITITASGTFSTHALSPRRHQSPAGATRVPQPLPTSTGQARACRWEKNQRMPPSPLSTGAGHEADRQFPESLCRERIKLSRAAPVGNSGARETLAACSKPVARQCGSRQAALGTCTAYANLDGHGRGPLCRHPCRPPFGASAMRCQEPLRRIRAPHVREMASAT